MSKFASFAEVRYAEAEVSVKVFTRVFRKTHYALETKKNSTMTIVLTGFTYLVNLRLYDVFVMSLQKRNRKK